MTERRGKSETPAEAARLLHELQTHQAELETQNEELRRVQAELEASRARYFDLYDLAPVGYLSVERHGLILEANLTAAGLLGLDRNRLISQPMTRFILPDGQDAYYRLRKRLAETGAPQGCELKVLRSGAEPFWAYLRAAMGKDSDGAPSCRIVLSDISQRKKLEAEREALFAREQAARAAAEAANQVKDDFLAIVSHELRTPLTAVLGWSWLLRSGELSGEERDRALDVIVRNMDAQRRIVDDILDASRFTRGQLTIEPRPLELGPLLESACESLSQKSEHRSIRVLRDIAPGVAVDGDPGRLTQVVSNLLLNALQFTPDGGEVRVSLRKEGAKAVVEVADSGEGMEPELIARIFDPFRQGAAALTRKHRGLGLGLAIVKQVVELHGGTASARSGGAGRGSVFSIELPAVDRSEAVAEPKAAFGQAGANELKGLTILVVEDEADTREMLAEVLKRRGAEVAVAASGPEAMSRLEREVPDAMLCDLAMPGEDGFALMDRVRRRGGKLGEVPAAALTALARPEDRRRALRAGFQMFLQKPLEPAELLSAVLTLSSRRAAD